MRETTNSASTQQRKKRRVKVGEVISNKMTKTIVVRVSWKLQHPFYRRTITRKNSFKVHDENNQANIGDLVRIVETRPLSKDKRWRLVEVVRKATLKDMPLEDALG